MGTKISVVILGEMEKSGDRMVQVQMGMRKLLRVMDMFIILIVMMVSQAHTYIKMYHNIHFKYAQFISCQSYLFTTFPEFTQTHVHRSGDAIQPSHPLSSPSPPAPNPSQHQGLFQ